MRNWIRYADERIGNLIIFNWVHSLAKVAATWTDAELAEKLKKVPSKERQEAWIRAARKPYTEEERGDGARQAGRDARQDGRDDAADQMAAPATPISIADIAVVPFIKRIDEEIAPDEMTPARHPRVAEWWATIQARPAFATARIEGFQDELAKIVIHCRHPERILGRRLMLHAAHAQIPRRRSRCRTSALDDERLGLGVVVADSRASCAAPAAAARSWLRRRPP